MTGAAPASLRVVAESASCAFAFRSDLALLLWGVGITPEQATAFGHALRQEVGTSPRVSTLVWLTGLPASAPTDEVRAVLARIIAHAPPSFVGLHYVVEAEGFGSAIARSVVTGLSLMAKKNLPVRVHASLAEAGAPLAVDLGWSAEGLGAVVEELEALRLGWSTRGGTAMP